MCLGEFAFYTLAEKEKVDEWREPWLFVGCYSEEASLHVAVHKEVSHRFKMPLPCMRLEFISKVKQRGKKNWDRKRQAQGIREEVAEK